MARGRPTVTITALHTRPTAPMTKAATYDDSCGDPIGRRWLLSKVMTSALAKELPTERAMELTLHSGQ